MMHEKKQFGQKLRNWKFFSFDRSSIDQLPIEPCRFKPKFLSHFQSVEQQVRLIKNLENLNFWKTDHFNAKLLKAHCFMNKMHEYDMKSFSKTLGFNLNLEYWSLHNSDLDHQHPIATSSRKLTTMTTWQLRIHGLLLSWIHSKHKYSHLCIIKLFMQQPNWSSSSWHNLDSW